MNRLHKVEASSPTKEQTLALARRKRELAVILELPESVQKGLYRTPTATK